MQAFYQNLYESQGFTDPNELLNHAPVKVTPANDLLDKPFVASEVREALFQMAPSKAPGVDGFTAGFYTCYKMMSPVRYWIFLNGGELPTV